jgi:adenylate cyclase class 2
MKSEIEAKFLFINEQDIRTILKKAGGELETPMRKLRRVIYEPEYLKEKSGYLRLRDQGDKSTLTLKIFRQLSLDGAQELEIEVSDFSNTYELLELLGLEAKSFQESKRETWLLDDCEIVIDEWPWLKPYIEIEGPSKKSVMAAASKLNLNWSEAVFGDVMAAYRKQYPHLTLKDTIANIPEVRFGDEPPELLRKG